jgi:hypothetical protein
MPVPHTFRRALLPAVVIASLAVVAFPVPSRAADMAAVHRIDRKVREAQHQLTHWQGQLARWQRHVVRLEAQVQRISYSRWLQALPPVPDVLTRGTAVHVSARARTRQAHRRLQALLRDHRAQEALQQTSAWSAYLSRLAKARETALARPAHRRPSATPSGPLTYGAWARAFLTTIGAPRCGDDLLLVVAWETQESTAALYNPLATTHDMDGATTFNGSGVKNYTSFAQGVQAAADTLITGSPSNGYQAVLDGLRACASADSVATSIRDSAWCRGCSNGAYLVGLLPIVRASYADHAARLIPTPA